jgi:hypothetical protein
MLLTTLKIKKKIVRLSPSSLLKKFASLVSTQKKFLLVSSLVSTQKKSLFVSLLFSRLNSKKIFARLSSLLSSQLGRPSESAPYQIPKGSGARCPSGNGL